MTNGAGEYSQTKVTGGPEQQGHHISEGRNVVPSGQGHAGHDIFFAAVQMSRMPMILTDPHQEDNPILFCNQAFEKLTGYPKDEILGRNCRFLQGPDTDRETISRIGQQIRKREDVHDDVLNYRKDGTAFWNALFISPVFTPNGELIYYFASQLDVTRRREAEAVLQQAQRLETLGSMSASVAHEFNNLMTVVLGSLTQIERSLPTDSRQLTRLNRAKWAVNQAGRLTQQMLSFARRQFHDNQTVDLNQTIANFDSILRQMAGARITVTQQLTPVPMMAMLDVSQLELALLNLVRNAADAMPRGGALLIQTRAATMSCGSPAIDVTVQDQGTGMPPDVLRRATEPFFTTKEKGTGTGLGLSMVKGFTEQSGGQMHIASDIGKGTTVTMRFQLKLSGQFSELS